MHDRKIARQRLSGWTLFGDGEQGVLLDRRTLDLKPVGDQLAETLGSIIASADDLPDDAPEWSEITEIIASIDLLPGLEAFSAAIPPDWEAHRGATDEPNGLFKLAISVADTCNLACTYCYANQGHFDRPAGRVMVPELAQTVVENAIGRFSAIDTVQFIGGEPSLNLPAIERACVAFRRAVDAGHLPTMPRFVVTTNGVRMDDAFIRLAKAMDLRPTISLDGPKSVHDRARIGPGGATSYDRVRKGIDHLLDAGITVEYEATFSRLHLQEGMHLIDLCQWFRDELGLRVLHAPPVSGGSYTPSDLTLTLDERIREYSAAAEWGVDNLLWRDDWMADSFTARVFQAFAARSRSHTICSAGHDLLCVAADGGVYPCWMFIGEEDLRLGDFVEEVPRPWDWTQAKNLFAPGDLDGHADCRACWARDLCFGCRAADLRAAGDLTGKPSCAFTQAIVASVAMRVFRQTDGGEATASDYLARPSFGQRLFESGSSDEG